MSRSFREPRRRLGGEQALSCGFVSIRLDSFCAHPRIVNPNRLSPRTRICVPSEIPPATRTRTGGWVHHAGATLHEGQQRGSAASNGGLGQRVPGVRAGARRAAVGHAEVLFAHFHGGVRRDRHGGGSGDSRSFGAHADEGVN